MKLSVKLPLMMGGLLVLMHAVMSTVTVLEMRQVTLRGASHRLQAVSGQIAGMLQTQVRLLTTRADSIAGNDALRRHLRAGDAASRAAALEAMTVTGANASQFVATQLHNDSGRLLLETGRWAGRLDGVPEARPGPGPLVQRGDSIVVPVRAAIEDGGRRAGALTMWLVLGGSAQGRESMSRLIGTGASVLVGSPESGVWTDLEKPAEAPPANVFRDSGTTSYERRGEPQLAAASAVSGAPWMVVVEFPRATVMAPVWDMLQRRLLIAVALLGIGLLATWRVSAHLNSQIERLTAEERQRSEQLGDTLRQLQETQEALMRRERLAILGQLSSSVGHELRNPLGVMTNAVYYLDAVAGNSAPKVREYLGILRQQIALSERIISDLLDFARVKPAQREEVPPAELVDAQVQRLGASPGVKVQKEYAGDLPRVCVDPVQVGQIVFNLLTNAVQALGERGGVLLVRLAREGEQHVRLDVSDNGPGISPEVMTRLFEPLFTTKARGIGLGLAVSRSLAQNNGAELTVSSTPGEGATFTLLLPLAAAVGAVAA